MIYSMQSVKEALTANNQRGKLHRELISLEDAIESEKNEREIAMFEENAPSYEQQMDDFREVEEDRIK